MTRRWGNSVAEIRSLLLRRGERGAIIGQTGTGKSVLARNLLPVTGRLAIIDPKRQFEYPGLPVYHTAAELKFCKPERFIYQPRPKDLGNLAEYDRVFYWLFTRRDSYIYIDDIVGVISRSIAPQGMAVCYQMGRQLGITILSSFQRPAYVPLYLITESTNFYLFRLSLDKDMKRVQEAVPEYWPEDLPDKHTFVFFDIYADNPARMYKIDLKGGQNAG